MSSNQSPTQPTLHLSHHYDCPPLTLFDGSAWSENNIRWRAKCQSRCKLFATRNIKIIQRISPTFVRKMVAANWSLESLRSYSTTLKKGICRSRSVATRKTVRGCLLLTTLQDLSDTWRPAITKATVSMLLPRTIWIDLGWRKTLKNSMIWRLTLCEKLNKFTVKFDFFIFLLSSLFSRI